MSGVQRPPTPTAVAIFRADYMAMLALIAPLAMGGVAAAARMGLLASPSAVPGLSLAAIVVAAIGLPVAWNRIRRIQGLFKVGSLTEGTVDRIWLERDRGRVEFSFQDSTGNLVATGQALHRNAAAEALQEGQTVQVLFDPKNTRFALLPELFS